MGRGSGGSNRRSAGSRTPGGVAERVEDAQGRAATAHFVHKDLHYVENGRIVGLDFEPCIDPQHSIFANLIRNEDDARGQCPAIGRGRRTARTRIAVESSSDVVPVGLFTVPEHPVAAERRRHGTAVTEIVHQIVGHGLVHDRGAAVLQRAAVPETIARPTRLFLEAVVDAHFGPAEVAEVLGPAAECACRRQDCGGVQRLRGEQ